MSQTTTPAQPRPLRRWLARLVAVLAVCVLTVLLFAPADTVMDVTLDSSNYGSYSYFTAKHFQYGPEVVPMVGPFGFVPYGTTYSGHLFWKRLWLELLTKGVLSTLIVWFFVQSARHSWLRWFWVLPLAVMTPFINDMPYSFSILLAGLCLISFQQVAGLRSLLVSCALAAFLGMLTLFKGTHTTLGMATLGVTLVQALLGRNLRRWAWIGATYLATILALLFAADQNPLNFPSYVRGVLELSSGYNLAMQLDELPPVFLHGVVTTALLLALILFCAWRHRRDHVALAGALLFGGFTFVYWKHGYVRSDGHVLIFFQYAYIAAAMILMFYGWKSRERSTLWSRLVAGTIATAIFALGLWGDGLQPVQRNLWVLQQSLPRLVASWGQLSAPAAAKQQLSAKLTEQRDFYQVPRMRTVVQDARIDFFGYELGYLILHPFNYHPRPVGGGSFTVFTPKLQDLNRDFLLDPARRPEFFLVNLQTIDDRFAAQDDAVTLRALLANYYPVESGGGLTLFRARPGPPVLPEPKLLRTETISWGVTIEVPDVGKDEMLLVSFSLPMNLKGRLRTALYKPPLVFMDVQGSGIYQPRDRRVIPGMFHYPVPLSPVLEDNYDLQDLYQGTSRKSVHSLFLRTTAPEFYDTANLTVSFYSAPRPARTPPAPIRLVNSRVSKVEPFVLEAYLAPMLRLEKETMVAQVLSPPAKMGFELRGDENMLVFAYGMSPPTYELPTDGVDIWVDLERPGRPAQRLFFRNLSPYRRPDDRGKFTARVPLPPCPPGSKVYLRVSRGPDGDGAWDLAYFTDIDLLHGPFIPEQFPGFATLPVSVDADVCGPGVSHEKNVFLLFANGSATFNLTGKERKLTFSAGMLEGAYTRGGLSDGVEFQAVMRTPAGFEHMLGRYYSNPREKPEDRTDRTFSVPIPADNAGCTLIIKATPGPSGSDAWDWSYIYNVRID